ncbi:hypothetical protein [Staphylococcus auricularis]|uniref:Uncharacterized protein n=1 Tax=Staphylococcus auricularis TaxID=29379 RepID=A0AAW7MAD7_9STAP|nr:hypothetical protein [Staphylococcus auricularis]MDC6328218.1 hypothetical protein [Staphylococcus auricularis]MDN4532220.1 hypothetical protein [Staphylococcus auricularis]
MNELSLEVKAQEIHERAVGFYKISEQYGYKFLMEIKTIRDEKLYKDLGFEKFEDYTLNNFNFSKRTINERLQDAESFGKEYERALASFGKHKTHQLATLPEKQRNEVLENGIETKDGKKPIEEATTRELEDYKKRNKSLEDKNAQLQSQVEQAQRSEEIARKKLEDEQNKEPEVIEKYTEPEDYQSIKNMNEHLESEREYYKQLADDFRNEVKGMMNQSNNEMSFSKEDDSEDYTPILLKILEPSEVFIQNYKHHLNEQEIVNKLEKIIKKLKEQ